ncbi:MAG: SulP family inorganic anion transporter [Planctomycetaceae bacterium]
MKTDSVPGKVPVGNAAGFVKYLGQDLLSGFLVFLIALPLCLGISLACGYPAIAGVFTAIIGAVLTTFISNSELTIKGPAAGLIVIALGTVQEFGFVAGGDAATNFEAYRMALAVGVAAGVIQIVFGLLKTGVLGEFFPTSAVHGMLAAIGVIIIAKQFPITLGVPANGGALELLANIPTIISQANPEIAVIGVLSLLLLFGWAFIPIKAIRRVPPQIVVVLATIPLGMYFGLTHEHTYTWGGHTYSVGENFLVDVPSSLFGAFATPDFSALATPAAWKWVMMFALIGSVESLLSAKAIDAIDPYHRRTNLNRDMLAIGVGNTVSAFVGGLPMISEIVRSKANLDNGAKTRFADMWHGLFLLLFVATIPALLHRIPLAALAAMLVYTGYRLASPKEFVNVFKIGKEQFIVFTATLVGTLATDLLKGIAIGIATEFVIHAINGVPLRSFFKPFLDVEPQDDGTVLIRARHSAVFSNWIPFRRQIEQIGLVQKNNVIVDLSDVKVVDHSVMEKFHEMERLFEQEGLRFELRGLDSLRQLSNHEFAARKAGATPIRRVTIVADAELEEELTQGFIACGASGFTITECRGAGRRAIREGSGPAHNQIRMEVIALPAKADEMLRFLRREILPHHAATVVAETVEVTRVNKFDLPETPSAHTESNGRADELVMR